MSLFAVQERPSIVLPPRPVSASQRSASLLPLPRALAEIVPRTLAHDYQIVPIDYQAHVLTVGLVSRRNNDIGRKEISNQIIAHKPMPAADIRFIELPLAEIQARWDAVYPPKKGAEATAEIPALWQQILNAAVERKASDIIIEPFDKDHGRVRFKIYGLCRADERFNLSADVIDRLIGYLRIEGSVQPEARQVPGDGSLHSTTTDGREADMRISTFPIHVNGAQDTPQRICLRLQPTSTDLLDLSMLGMTEDLLAIFRAEIERPDFRITIAGRQGTGKSTTARACLAQLPLDELDVASLENPVEIPILGVAQSQIPVAADQANKASQLTFASALRAYLRQPLDAVFVGEIRDEESMRLMITAATSGMSLISTVHAHNAIDIINRFTQLGASLHDIPDALTIAMSQRLLRRLCEQCRQPRPFSHQAKEIAEAFEIALPEHGYALNPTGCEHCDHGIAGCTGVFEILPIAADVADAIVSNASSATIARLGWKHGYRPMLANAMEHLANGTVDEVSVKRALHFIVPEKAPQ